jgi:hypothetical protein
MRSSASFLLVSRSEGNGENGKVRHSRSEDWPDKPILIRYARSNPGRRQWREPLEVALSRKGLFASLVAALYVVDLSVEILARIIGLF